MSVVQVIKQRDMPILENIARIFSRESIPSDSLRLDKVYETILKEVCEKDADVISKLEDKSIPEANGNLDAARINLAAAQKKYERSAQERISKAGEVSEPSEEENRLKAILTKAEHEVYRYENDVKELMRKLAKRKEHRERTEKQLDTVRERLARLANKRLKEKERNRLSEARGREQETTQALAGPREATTKETELKRQLAEAIEDLNKATEA